MRMHCLNYLKKKCRTILVEIPMSTNNRSAPLSKKRSICISDFIQTTFFYLGSFLKKLADDQCSSRTKDSIYHIKHNGVHTTFYHSSGLTRNLTLNGCIYHVLYFAATAFLLGTAEMKMNTVWCASPRTTWLQIHYINCDAAGKEGVCGRIVSKKLVKTGCKK